MKIYILLLLISTIVMVSHLAKRGSTTAADGENVY
jgi:hypothetical protein